MKEKEELAVADAGNPGCETAGASLLVFGADGVLVPLPISLP
jgi:hypothetical protein